MNWDRDGHDWPHRGASRFVAADGIRFHVQQMGQGPVVLLLHGTGASTHSWRGLMPLLAPHFTVLAPDLPGHAFTHAPERRSLSLPGMARAISALVRVLDLDPAYAIGHSAGAAVLVRMALDGGIAPRGITSLNGALRPFEGVASHVFSPLAKLLVLNPVVPRLFSWAAGGPDSVQRLIRDTGSALDPEGIALYARLLRSPEHVAGALRMMASWDLAPLWRDLTRLTIPLLLVAAGNDRTIRPDDAFRVRDRVPGASVEYLRGVGHLAHEEQPARVADLVIAAARNAGALPAAEPILQTP